MAAAERLVSRKGLFYFLLILCGGVAFVVFGEVLSLAYYYAKDGQYISPAVRLAAERNAYIEAAQARDCAYGDSVILHPYLANVSSPFGFCGAGYANSKSLIGREFPDRKQARVGYILVTGGSVAAQLVWDNRQQASPLEHILNEQFAGDRYDRFVVLNGGHGAWKQPQQYILFGLYADVLAGVITLDGFNEHYMITANRRFEAPSNNFFQIARRQDPGRHALSEMALRMEARFYRFALGYRICQMSSFCYFVLDKIRGGLRFYGEGLDTQQADRTEDWVNQSYASMFAFYDKMDDREREQWALHQYEKYIRLMNAGGKELGIPVLFLIQSTPAIDKPLSGEEKAFTYQTNVPAYTAMVRHLTGLRTSRGIPVYSLGDVFRNTHSTVYTDHIHVNELGKQLMAERIADLIEKVWGWPRLRIAHS